MQRSYLIGEFADELGIHVQTVKRWCRNDNHGYTRTPGGERLIPHRELRRLAGGTRPTDHIALYARVFNHSQKANGNFDCCGVSITVIEDETDKSAQEELVGDLSKLVASFSDKLYGTRSSKEQQVVNTVESAVRPDE